MRINLCYHVSNNRYLCNLNKKEMKNIEKSRTSLKQVRQSKRLQPLRVLQWLNVKEVSVKKRN